MTDYEKAEFGEALRRLNNSVLELHKISDKHEKRIREMAEFNQSLVELREASERLAATTPNSRQVPGNSRPPQPPMKRASAVLSAKRLISSRDL